MKGDQPLIINASNKFPLQQALRPLPAEPQQGIIIFRRALAKQK
ncbi:hypothetical protein [Roseibium sp. RKSG952]|nr:hypothetical protein [Roseibium sp. RKSG952]